MTQGASDGRSCSPRARELAGFYGQSGGIHKLGRNTPSHYWLTKGSSLGFLNPEKKKKKNPIAKHATTEAKPLKQFKDYNFTPLNVSIHEVLMEARKDLDYVHPQKITKESPEKNNDKYCTYHDAMRHHTEGCVSLRLMIERFIGSKKLVYFLIDNQAQPSLNRDKEPRDNPPRNQRRWAPSPRRHQEDRPWEHYRRSEKPRREEPRRERSRSRSVRQPNPQDQRVIAEIRTISEGFARGGETSANKKANEEVGGPGN
jgi:hypothetical protein